MDWEYFINNDLTQIAYNCDRITNIGTAKIFSYFCYTANSNLFTDIVQTKMLCEVFNLSTYKVRKSLNELKSLNLIKRASCGCPGGATYTESGMSDCWDSHPPINGFNLTELAIGTNCYKKAYEYINNAYREWANYSINEER